jgi:hypothetical protein
MANNGPTYRVNDGSPRGGNLIKLTAKEADAFIASHPGAFYADNPRAVSDADELPPIAGMPSLQDVEGDAVDAAAQARAQGDLVRVNDGTANGGNLIKLRQGEVQGFVALHPGAFVDGRPPAARMLGIDREPENSDPTDVRARLLAQSRPQLNAIAAGLGIDGAGMKNKIEVTDAIMAAQDKGPDDDAADDGLEALDDDALADLADENDVTYAEADRPSILAALRAAGIQAPAGDDGLEDLDDAALSDLADKNEITATSREDAIAQLREKGVKAPGDDEKGQDGQNGGNGSA